MKIERIFTVPENETTIRARVAAFLEQSGYKSVDTEPSITYRRGDILGFASFSPKGWRVKATVQMAGSSSQNQVTAVFDIDTTLQWVTEKERTFWKYELDCLETSVMTGVIDTGSSTKSAQSSRTQNLYAYILIIVLALGFAIVARALFASPIIYWAGLVIGGVIGILIAWRWLNFKIGGV